MKETKKVIQEFRNKGNNEEGTKIGINVGTKEDARNKGRKHLPHCKECRTNRKDKSK